MLRHSLPHLAFQCMSQPLNPQTTSEGMLANETMSVQEGKCFSYAEVINMQVECVPGKTVHVKFLYQRKTVFLHFFLHQYNYMT